MLKQPGITQVKYDEGLNTFHKLKDYIKTSLSIRQNPQLQDDEKNEIELGDNHEYSLSMNVKSEENDFDVTNTRFPKSSGNVMRQNQIHFYFKHKIKSMQQTFRETERSL